MRRITLEQGSQEWLDWRKKFITATDAPVILGVSPYSTPYKTWQRKLGLIAEQKDNPGMKEGRINEGKARDLFIQQYGIVVTPCCIESDKHNFIGASLDGLSECGKYGVEIKYQDPETIKNGIPLFHLYQMQKHFLVSDYTIEKIFYVSIWNGSIIVHEVLPDLEWGIKYLPLAQEFWRKVVFFEAPALTCRDYKDMSDSPNFITYAHRYLDIDAQIKNLEKKKEVLREEIIKLCGDQSGAAAGIKVLKKNVKGRIDYEAIPEISSINLENYRKPSTTSWSIMIDQK